MEQSGLAAVVWSSENDRVVELKLLAGEPLEILDENFRDHVGVSRSIVCAVKISFFVIVTVAAPTSAPTSEGD